MLILLLSPDAGCRLIVDEDDTTHTMKFELKPGTGGIMKK